MSRRDQSAWRQEWAKNAPETARYVEMRIVCDVHPRSHLWSHCLSTVPGVAMETWVKGKPDQWTPHHLDATRGFAETDADQCQAPGCRIRPQIRADDSEGILRAVAERVSDDGRWDVPAQVVERLLVPYLRANEPGRIAETFASPAILRTRGSRNE